METINSTTELKSVIYDKLKIAIDSTTEVALNKLLDIIEHTVYSYNATWTNGSGGEFGRTHEFYDTWGKTKAKMVRGLRGSAVAASIMQMLPLTWHQPFSHGSVVEGRALTINELDNIINSGISESHINFPAIEARPFWDEFEKWCNENLTNIFQRECISAGLEVRKVGFAFSF